LNIFFRTSHAAFRVLTIDSSMVRVHQHADNYLAMKKLAAIRIWLRVNESMA